MARERKKAEPETAARRGTASGLVGKSEIIPAGYVELLEDLKGRIRSAQIKTALAVNKELVLLYWEIGREITRRQLEEGWGQKIIDRLGKDLQSAFPGLQGFSRTNVY